jgi:hypothetical protein
MGHWQKLPHKGRNDVIWMPTESYTISEIEDTGENSPLWQQPIKEAIKEVVKPIIKPRAIQVKPLVKAGKEGGIAL